MEITGQANRIFCRKKNVLKIYIFPAHHHHQAFFVPIIWDQLHGFYPSTELYKKVILLHILHLYNTPLVADPDLSSKKLEWKCSCGHHDHLRCHQTKQAPSIWS